jgi:hypothetical protein
MSDFALFCVVFAYSAVLWVVVLVLYSMLVESLDFGRLWLFAVKSLVLIGVVAAVVRFVPGGILVSMLAWGVGLVLIMRLDFSTAGKVILILGGVNLVAWLLLYWLVLSGPNAPSLSTVGGVM